VAALTLYIPQFTEISGSSMAYRIVLVCIGCIYQLENSGIVSCTHPICILALA
jgi:hypothetical protein